MVFTGYKSADAEQRLDRLMGGLHCDDWEIAAPDATAPLLPALRAPPPHSRTRVVAPTPRRIVIAAPAPARTLRRTEDA